jgi:carbamoyl-phosphate synthase large subunit
VLQEYICDDDGEFTVGVLHLTDGRRVGSVALRRVLESKLSIMHKTSWGVISSGYSQGLIDDFPALAPMVEQIAASLGSRGPLNVQGRVRNGVLLPFEINARFSASTYLRALAGFNEVDLFLQFGLHGTLPNNVSLRRGYYLRSLSETCVPVTALRTVPVMNDRDQLDN